jgi:hypothetical protein
MMDLSQLEPRCIQQLNPLLVCPFRATRAHHRDVHPARFWVSTLNRKDKFGDEKARNARDHGIGDVFQDLDAVWEGPIMEAAADVVD